MKRDSRGRVAFYVPFYPSSDTPTLSHSFIIKMEMQTIDERIDEKARLKINEITQQ